jgi:putative spermidine/putrescine transport system permease protein
MKVAGRTIDLSWIYVYAVLFFLLSPLLAIVVLSISKTVYLQFPPELFSIQWYIALFKSEKLLRSLYLSVRVAVPATVLATFCGTLAALGARALGLRVSAIGRLLFLGPLIVPYVILATGISRLFVILGFRGIDAITLAHATIASPYVFLLVNSGMKLLPKSVEEAARVLGAGSFQAMWRVTLPLLKPHIFAGMMFAFIASFGEFIIAYMLAGPYTTLLTVHIYSGIREKTEPAITALLTLLTASVVIMAFFYSQYYGRQKRKAFA